MEIGEGQRCARNETFLSCRYPRGLLVRKGTAGSFPTGQDIDPPSKFRKSRRKPEEPRGRSATARQAKWEGSERPRLFICGTHEFPEVCIFPKNLKARASD